MPPAYAWSRPRWSPRVYEFVTFFVPPRVFHADERLFHTSWFVESLATQTPVLFVIRTAGNPLRSRPSLPLVVSTLVIVGLGAALPYTPLARVLGFARLPLAFYGFLAAVTLTYLLLVEAVKWRPPRLRASLVGRRHRARSRGRASRHDG